MAQTTIDEHVEDPDFVAFLDRAESAAARRVEHAAAELAAARDEQRRITAARHAHARSPLAIGARSDEEIERLRKLALVCAAEHPEGLRAPTLHRWLVAWSEMFDSSQDTETCRYLLRKSVKHGDLLRVERGVYVCPEVVAV